MCIECTKKNLISRVVVCFFSSYILLLPSRLLQTMREKQANKQRFLDGKPHFFCVQIMVVSFDIDITYITIHVVPKSYQTYRYKFLKVTHILRGPYD
jgi:hypothetical protein